MSIDATCSRCVDAGEGTYWMTATCGNCDREFDVELSKGHRARDSQPACSFCGVRDSWTWRAVDISEITELRVGGSE